ncbi:MAG TPA: hypothetical protein VMT30_09380 [Candidatus Saccharimonadia bacterium]|nr:hypothetical protein [Candidatus Saccharimonadia bacterium]
MNTKVIAEARAEAERFLRRLNEMDACTKHRSSYDACPSRAAVKRASLDLTRALANLRRP